MFPSRGPTINGCIKPDLVAPSVTVYSAQSQHADTLATTAADNLGLKPPELGRLLDTLSKFDTGSSMPTPVVAGAVACLRELLVKKMRNPSANLIKAILINTAFDLSKKSGKLQVGIVDPSRSGNPQIDLPMIPNGIQGGGRFDLATTLKSIQDPQGRYGTYENTVSWIRNRGDYCQFTITVPAPTGPSKRRKLFVHMVYNDVPGADLQNDLVLEVIDSAAAKTRSDGVTYDAAGQEIQPSASVATYMTNVKHVFLQNAPEGRTIISVGTKRLSMWTPPGTTVQVWSNQPFAVA